MTETGHLQDLSAEAQVVLYVMCFSYIPKVNPVMAILPRLQVVLKVTALSVPAAPKQ